MITIKDAMDKHPISGLALLSTAGHSAAFTARKEAQAASALK
jgi:hypothetical protein